MRLALKHRRIPYAGLLYRGLTCVITAPTSQTMGRAHRRSFLKFVIGTLFHKPAPETRNVGLSQRNWREFGGKFVSAVWLLHVPHFPESSLSLSLSSSSLPHCSQSSDTGGRARELRSRFPARLIILLAGNECLPRVISFRPALFTPPRPPMVPRTVPP